MASSGENKTAERTVDSIIVKGSSSSTQQVFFAKWLQNRDSTIWPPKELLEEPSSECHLCEKHKGHGLTKRYSSAGGSSLSGRCPHHHSDHISSRNFEDENCGKLVMSKQQTNPEPKRNTSPYCASGTSSTSSNEQRTSHARGLRIRSHSSTNIKPGETKSKIPIKIRGSISSSSSSLTHKRISSDNRMSKIPVPFNTRHSVLPKGAEEKLKINVDDDFNNGADKDLMRKQNGLKAYYDSFPNIDDATNETSLDIRRAKEFTESILRNLPSGEVTDTNTVCHVLNKLLGNEDQECLFYDSAKGINLHDASVNLADINSEDRSFVLKLSSSEGLERRGNVKTEQDDLKLVKILTKIIEQNQSHPVLEDITERLSKAHGVDQKSIMIKTVFVGTLNIVYTVMDLTKAMIKSFIELKHELMKQFKQFFSLKIHPLLFRPSFDIAYFDKRGNKSFPTETETHEVGPPGHTKLYTTPSGWTRNGFKVLNKYENDDWLHPFQHPGNWYRAFHGTRRAKSEDFDDKNQPCDIQYTSVDALSSIFQTGFRLARVNAYGPGVYCSPDPKFSEQKYVCSVPLDTQKGNKTFKCMLQVAVNPNGVKFTENKDIWVVPKPEDIRPYGILIKEA